MSQVFDTRGEKVLPLGIYTSPTGQRPRSLLRFPDKGGSLAQEVSGLLLTLTVYVFSPLLVPCSSRVRMFRARIEGGVLISVQPVYDPFSGRPCIDGLLFGAFTAPSANTIPLFFSPVIEGGQYRTIVTAGAPLDYRLAGEVRPGVRYRDESAPVYVMPFYPSGFRAAGRVCLPCSAGESGCSSMTDCVRASSHAAGRRGNNSRLVASLIGGKRASEYRIEDGRVVKERRETELSKPFIVALSLVTVVCAVVTAAAIAAPGVFSSSRSGGRRTQRSSKRR